LRHLIIVSKMLCEHLCPVIIIFPNNGRKYVMVFVGLFLCVLDNSERCRQICIKFSVSPVYQCIPICILCQFNVELPNLTYQPPRGGEVFWESTICTLQLEGRGPNFFGSVYILTLFYLSCDFWQSNMSWRLPGF